MKLELLSYLVCPQCGRDVTRSSRKLSCAAGHVYAVRNHVPILLSPNVSEEQSKTADSFSDKWASIPDYGYDPATEDFRLKWYLERYGWIESEFNEFLAGRKLILDAGTGLGSQAKMYADRTTGQVFGVDISQSVDIAYEHTKHIPNCHIIQADITKLPFKKGMFDFIASDQVLHHTPDTEKSFRYLAEFLAPGGQIVIYVYKKKAPLREMADDYLRAITTKMTWQECYEFSEQIALLGKALTEVRADVRIEKDIPLLGIKAGTHDVQRFVYWNFLKCFWNEKFDLKGNAIVNADWYHPAFAWRHTHEEVERWFRDAGLAILHEDVSESGISIRGLR